MEYMVTYFDLGRVTRFWLQAPTFGPNGTLIGSIREIGATSRQSILLSRVLQISQPASRSQRAQDETPLPVPSDLSFQDFWNLTVLHIYPAQLCLVQLIRDLGSQALESFMPSLDFAAEFGVVPQDDPKDCIQLLSKCLRIGTDGYRAIFPLIPREQHQAFETAFKRIVTLDGRRTLFTDQEKQYISRYASV